MSTLTSTASILTGTSLSRHQTWSYTKQTEADALPDRLRTVPELPDETTNKASEFVERTEVLTAAAVSFLETAGAPIVTENQKEMDEEMEQHLRDMGYAV